MNEDFIGAMLGLGVVGIVAFIGNLSQLEIPVLIGLLLVVVIFWALFWRSFLQPALDPMLSGY